MDSVCIHSQGAIQGTRLALQTEARLAGFGRPSVKCAFLWLASRSSHPGMPALVELQSKYVHTLPNPQKHGRGTHTHTQAQCSKIRLMQPHPMGG